eukprot:jgi/Psemu1/58879/gm1.58879_g
MEVTRDYNGPPYHSNLGKTVTVIELTKAMITTCDKWTPVNTQNPTLQGLIYAICAGGPIELFLKRREKIKGEGDYIFAEVEWFSMSFDLMINSLRNLNGKHSKEAFIAFCQQ